MAKSKTKGTRSGSGGGRAGVVKRPKVRGGY